MGGGVSLLDRKNSFVDENISCATENVSINHQPTFTVSLGFCPYKELKLPDIFKLRISYESLDFITIENEYPIIQFPYQSIICWGSSLYYFQFKVFSFDNKQQLTAVSENEKNENGILISLKTLQGRQIEDATMATVQKLMKDINHRAISQEEFDVLLITLLGKNQNELVENWNVIIEQFTAGGRKFLAKQGMELLQKIGVYAPFEKVDIACVLYDKIINPESFQLLISTFEDEQDRKNVIHRIAVNNKTAPILVSSSKTPHFTPS